MQQADPRSIEGSAAAVLKVAQVRSHLLRLIGGLPARARLPNEIDLARCCAVGRGTVRRAMGQLVDEGILQRFPGRGTFLLPNKARSDGRTDSQGRIVLLTAWRTERYHPFQSEKLRGVADTLGQAGVTLDIVDASGAVLPRLLACAADPEVRGLISFHAGVESETPLRQVFGKPIVTTYPTDGRGAGGTAVISDMDEAFHRLAATVRQRGHRRIALLCEHPERIKAFREVFEADTPISLHSYERSESGGYRAMREVWTGRPTAAFIDDDTVARGAIAFLLEQRVRIPRQLSVCVTANRGVEFTVPVPISTVELDPYAIGCRTAAAALAAVRGHPPPPGSVRVTARFIDRESIGTAAETRATEPSRRKRSHGDR
jgi:DNA-binding LacI/PurR family transcriptional regulator